MATDENQRSGCSTGFWILALLFGGLFVLTIASVGLITMIGDSGGGPFASLTGDKIGVVKIKGPIKKARHYTKALHKFSDANHLKGILVRIDSPGGAVAPSQEIFQAVDSAADKKPVVVSMANAAASGGYYIACGADTIFANPGSITGSIGVISQVFDVSKLLDKAQVEVNTVKTGKYKDAGSPFREFDEVDRKYFRQLLEDVHAQFVTDVAESRPLDKKKIESLADGRVFTGQQAKQKGLVDKLGSFRDAIDYVKDEAGIEGEVDLVYPEKPSKGFFGRFIKELTSSAIDGVKSEFSPLLEYRMSLPSQS